jgi:hypothetical protein
MGMDPCIGASTSGGAVASRQLPQRLAIFGWLGPVPLPASFLRRLHVRCRVRAALMTGRRCHRRCRPWAPGLARAGRARPRLCGRLRGRCTGAASMATGGAACPASGATCDPQARRLGTTRAGSPTRGPTLGAACITWRSSGPPASLDLDLRLWPGPHRAGAVTVSARADPGEPSLPSREHTHLEP